MSNVLDKYCSAKEKTVHEVIQDCGEEFIAYVYAGKMYGVIKELFDEIKNEPRGFDYAFLSVEHAQLDIEGHIYDSAKENAKAAFDVLSKLEASTDVRELLFKATSIIAESRKGLDDWSGIDQLIVTKLNYEHEPKRLSAMIDYAYALNACGRLSENEELLREIVDAGDQFLESDDVFMARKLKKLFIDVGESERGQKIYERILLNEIKSLNASIDYMDSSIDQEYIMDKASRLLEELGRDKDDPELKKWYRRRELYYEPWKRLP